MRPEGVQLYVLGQKNARFNVPKVADLRAPSRQPFEQFADSLVRP